MNSAQPQSRAQMRRQSQQGRRDQLSDGRYPALPLPLPQAWRALVALCIGFFMILLDQTIVAVATPAFLSLLQI